MFLAGDIGGTKTHLAFFEVEGGRLRRAEEETYRSRDYPGLAPILRAFLDKYQRPAERVSLGIAGPVRQGRVETPNLPWVIDADHLQDELGCGPVTLLNDLEANAQGIGALGPDDFVVLNAGVPVPGNAALISAGTGLGEAGLYWDGKRHHPFASEGGHADFAPRTPREQELAAYLAGQFGHVSYERILSGPGLRNVYDFLRQRGGTADELPDLMQRHGVQDPSAAISIAALNGESDVCRQALELFVAVYGAEAGNLALKILPTLREPAYVAAFQNKGRLASLLETIPVRVILNQETALLGAARYAAGLHELS
jgi:glucokinase